MRVRQDQQLVRKIEKKIGEEYEKEKRKLRRRYQEKRSIAREKRGWIEVVGGEGGRFVEEKNRNPFQISHYHSVLSSCSRASAVFFAQKSVGKRLTCDLKKREKCLDYK